MGAHKITHNLRLQFVNKDEWHWIADLDEFHEFDRPVNDLLATIQQSRYNSVAGIFVDRITEDGYMPPIGDGDIFQQFPVQSDITVKLLKANARKIQLLKGHLPPIHCYHSVVGEKPFPVQMKVHHFKWNSSCVARLQKRILQLRANGYSHQIESVRFFNFISKYGRIDLDAVNRLK